ncbi:type II toxin-antitoxin system RelE/ParE family toxin [Candidatus Pacearchaeota archaeon]|nr:type II toxin-antitoxin system RelE/ParE family toxin [Candidatus Pacearchaeota archaeon]
MVVIRFSKIFTNKFSKMKDELLRTKVKKQIRKITDNPKVGKPMRNIRVGTRELYIFPFRLSYRYVENENMVEVLDLYHKKHQ